MGADESIGEWFARVVELSLQSDGAAEVVFDTGEQVSGRVAAWGDAATTAIASSKCLPKQFELHLVTSTGDEIRVELPRPDDVAPLRGRPTVYLDQNHLSTLTNALHAPARHGSDERAAALGLIDLVRSGEVVLPMSAGHVGETAKQANEAERYRRALTLAQLSGGWQLLDPLTVRRIELRQALARRYLAHSPSSFAVVTLAPGSVSIAKPTVHDLDNDTELPPAARWIFETVSSISAVFEAMLAESIPMSPVPDWAPQFEAFARFLEANPSGPELKKNRTLAKFIADLGTELPIAAHQAGVSGDQMSDWALTFSDSRRAGDRSVSDMLGCRRRPTTLRSAAGQPLRSPSGLVGIGVSGHFGAERPASPVDEHPMRAASAQTRCRGSRRRHACRRRRWVPAMSRPARRSTVIAR